ncbi:MAG TPA: signal peptidase I [Silvibacterium sp.]|nr:signal peptidase I [Silvibacterium sp.]
MTDENTHLNSSGDPEVVAGAERGPNVGAQPAPGSESPIEPSPKLPLQSRAGLWLRDILISVAASFMIITFVYQPVRVEGTSMQPELRDQDRLFINKFAYHFENISRGDVVVFHYPRDPSKSYIKRVIALPGDTLDIDDGRVYVNGKRVAESYVPREYQDGRSQPEMVIPTNEFFVMGDHRSISSDSRDFGPVNRDLIYGKAAFVYWPADNMGVIR